MNIEPTELYIERNEEIRRTKEALQNQMQCVGELKEYLHNAQQMIDALKQQVEDLKCCGNCKFLCSTDEKCTSAAGANSYCDNWTYDGWTREERK